MKNHRVIFYRVLWSVLSILTVAFIFINSIFDADLSAQQSGSVLTFLNYILSHISDSLILTEHFVRKCAHFAEYFTLGAFLFLACKSFLLRLNAKILLAPVVGLAVAIIDEFIQRFSVGRSSQLSDVLLDFSGVCTACVLLFVICKLVYNFKKNNDKEVIK